MRVPDCLFPTDNAYGVPLLRNDLQGLFVDLPVCGWGCVSRKSRMKGTWHFYVDDSKFSALWKHPEGVLKTKAYNCAEANYTTDEQMPFAVGLYRIYQKRWMARFWQEHGMNIFVDLNVAPKFYKANILGVPSGWSSFATSACDSKIDMLMEHAEIAKQVASGAPLRFLVYGGGPKVRELCGEQNWVNIPDARNTAREVQNAEGK
jgi:hypothetical protein